MYLAHHPFSDVTMNELKYLNLRICGIDPHKKRFTSVILNFVNESIISVRTFSNDRYGYNELAEWLSENMCSEVVIETSNNFWYAIYDCLKKHGFSVHAVSPSQVPRKRKKSDKHDAAWIALMYAKGLVEESYVPDENIRKLRNLIRIRRKLVDESTSHKNRVQSLLSAARLDLKRVFSDIFGVSGMRMLKALIAGDADDAIRVAPAKKREVLMEVLSGAYLESLDKDLILVLLAEIERINEAISRIEMMIARVVDSDERIKKQVEILISIPGVDMITAATVIAEIGDFERFIDGKQIASYSGLVPRINESNGKQWGRGITKRGSPYLRHVLTEAAGSIVRTKASKSLYLFYYNIMKRRGHKVALVALARKLLVVMHALVMKGEKYRDASKSQLITRKLKRIEAYARRYEKMIRVEINELRRMLEIFKSGGVGDIVGAASFS